MEFEVRVVGGIESCFVSLPLSLIQTLQSTSISLPPVLALQLRSNQDHLWHVAWSGSASSSSSSAIEVAQQLADCISLPDHMVVQVRAISHLPKATEVTIEPHGEDDWEVLELNSEHAEAVILKQVGIVHAGMKFPLWVHGHIVTVFHVVSTHPEKPVVQLVPGTEVVVAPKTRKTNMKPSHGSSIQSSDEEHSMAKALLRIQDSKLKLYHRSEVNNIGVSVMLTTAVFIHPETAKKSMLDNLQVVFLHPRTVSKKKLRKQKDGSRTKSSLMEKETNVGGMNKTDVSRNTVVRLIYSDVVTRGHVMLPECLRYYLRADLHSWVYVKCCKTTTRKDVPLLSLSPCRFKLSGKENILKVNGLNTVESRRNRKMRAMPLDANLIANEGILDWSVHEEVFAFLSPHTASNDQDGIDQSSSSKGQKGLLHAWFIGQLKAIGSDTEVDMSSLVLGNETLLHFEVSGGKFQSDKKQQELSDHPSKTGIRTGEPSLELVYLLSATESSDSGRNSAFELFLEDEDKSIDNLKLLDILFRKLDLAEPSVLDIIDGKSFEKSLSSDISSLGWMGTATSDVIDRLRVLLSPSTGKLFSRYKRPLPGQVLIYGPPGSGKTLLATAVAKSFEEDGDILAHIVYINCSRLSLEKPSAVQQKLEEYLSEALEHLPSLVIFDDLDNIVSSSIDPEGSQTTSTTALVEFLTDILDDFEVKRQSVCGVGPIAFMACAQSLENFPKTLSSAGRFDFHVQLPAPAVAERVAILKYEVHKRSLQCSEEILSDIASKCDGYDAYDLEILVDRAIHSSIGRFLSSFSTFEDSEDRILVREDFSKAMTDFLPVSMRDITKSASEDGRTGWDEVGGLLDIKNAVQEMIELPSKFPNIFAQAPLRLRSNVLLYGPPGCGKTHIVGAAAAACSLRFISVKGPELLNKYIGASEQAVRDIFSKAAAAAPCLLFFDEFDSIAPKRGHDNTGVTDRVVNQFLTELDGVEALTGVFVFAATSRPDLLDAALLRPGRFDRLLYCDFPSWHDRFDILTVLSRKLPLASDVNLAAIASVTEGFSGADLQALLSDAQLASVHELLDNSNNDTHGKMPVMNDAILRSVVSKARPSVSEAEKRRLRGIYGQFLDSKKSAAAQSMDAKGKRATLA